MVQASGVSLDDGACCINGCSRDVHARGMCRMHYDRWRRSGMGARKKRMSRACIQCGRFFETERRDKKTWFRQVSEGVEQEMPQVSGSFGFQAESVEVGVVGAEG